MNTSDSFSKSELLAAPYGVGSYLMLEEYVLESGDSECFGKLLDDYGAELPLFKLEHLLRAVYWENDRNTYQRILEVLFRKCTAL